MSRSKLVTPWLSKRSVRHTLTNRPNQTRILPEWMERDNIKKLNEKRDLLCHEAIVKCVPTLQNMACASIVANGLFKNFDNVENHVWTCLGNTKIEFIYENPCRNTDRWHVCKTCADELDLDRFNIACGVGFANQFNNSGSVYSYKEKVYAAYPMAAYDVVLKAHSKDFSHEQLRSGLRPKKSVKRKLSFSEID